MPVQSPQAWGDGSWSEARPLSAPRVTHLSANLLPQPPGRRQAGGYCWTSLPAWSKCATGLVEELRRMYAAHLETLRNLHTLLTEQTQKRQLPLEKMARLRAELNSAKKLFQEVQEDNQAVPSKVYITIYDWALKSSGATIDTQRTSETYTCRENWGCRVVGLFFPSKPPDAILQPDVSPGNCWPFPGHQGQVVIRLPARVCLTAVTLQHIYKEVSLGASPAPPETSLSS
ncbi:SUN domain-containing protein 5-like [Strix aluco]|uniref:SUN domain-containing protein 5-like n=1 Tax=Strix aluco TaxID=111821 RepID=UPI003DA3C0E8